MPHYREKQNLKSNPKCEESVKALTLTCTIYILTPNYRLCD